MLRPNDEGHFEGKDVMANDWPTVSLAQVLKQNLECVDELEDRNYQRLSVKLYGKGVEVGETVHSSSVVMKRHQIAKVGQVVLSMMWGKKGSIGVIPTSGEGAIVTTNFYLFDVDTAKIKLAYLDWVLRANCLEDQLMLVARGTASNATTRPKQLLAYTIPLPPLAEQQRIVARIEELARRVEEARGLRREAVGEAEALHGSMAAEALNRLSSAPRKTLGDICEVRGGLQKSPARIPRDHPTPYLTDAHVQRNRINISSDFRYFEVSPEELERWRLEAGDLLIIDGNGSADQIGRVALFRGEIKDCVHQNHVIRARPNRNIAEPEYLNIYIFWNYTLSTSSRWRRRMRIAC